MTISLTSMNDSKTIPTKNIWSNSVRYEFDMPKTSLFSLEGGGIGRILVSRLKLRLSSRFVSIRWVVSRSLSKIEQYLFKMSYSMGGILCTLIFSPIFNNKLLFVEYMRNRL